MKKFFSTVLALAIGMGLGYGLCFTFDNIAHIKSDHAKIIRLMNDMHPYHIKKQNMINKRALGEG